MEQVRTSPRNMIIAALAAAALAVGAWIAATGPGALSSDHAKAKSGSASSWR